MNRHVNAIAGRLSLRNSGNWEPLGVALISPWLDNRPLQTSAIPEIREYRLCWYENNKISGDFSPIQRITIGN
jgi:acetyl esterase/lipase